MCGMNDAVLGMFGTVRSGSKGKGVDYKARDNVYDHANWQTVCCSSGLALTWDDRRERNCIRVEIYKPLVVIEPDCLELEVVRYL